MKTFKTTDFQLTAYAISNGARLEGVEKVSDKQSVFTVTATDDVETKFWRDETIQKFLEAQRRLKRELFSTM